MPMGDGTGPMGLGPMTGRAAGYCAGFGVPGYVNPIPGRGFWGRGRGFGRGRGGGRGWRHCYYATGLPGWARAAWGTGAYPVYGVPFAGPVAPQPTHGQETEALKAQAQYFEEALAEINKRIDELEQAKESG